MPRTLYIRPTAPLSPASAIDPSARPKLLSVAGLHFAAAELIERSDQAIRRRLLSSEQLLTTDLRLAERELLDRLQRPRAPVAGLGFDKPLIMGILNVTPDSFSDGGRFLSPDAAVAHALKLEADGADILDIGGESTRPGSEGVDVDEECRRVVPVIRELAKRSRARLSIDTRKPEVMRRAAAEGVHIINDVSGLTYHAESLPVAAASGLPVVLMHARGDPRTMQQSPTYRDVVLDVCDWLADRVEACEAAGMPRSRLIVDPGIGFGKTLEHNLSLLRSLSLLHGLGCPLLLGASRKSFITRLTGAEPNRRLPGSIAAALAGASQGVQILRVHDVSETRQALALWREMHLSQ